MTPALAVRKSGITSHSASDLRFGRPNVHDKTGKTALAAFGDADVRIPAVGARP